ncbi:MAG: hypothetical protein Q9166_001501 [cf. Caloplaca sp. 2 TL-2023]
MKPTLTLLTILAATQGITALKVPPSHPTSATSTSVSNPAAAKVPTSSQAVSTIKMARMQKPEAIFLHGPSTFAYMDIDCDGDLFDPGDGRYRSSEDTQGQMDFFDQVRKIWKDNIKELSANVYPYVVVFGNDREDGGPTFDPGDLGSKLVECDTNGDDGKPLVGEASISLATVCYGNSVNGNSGHDEDDVLYVAFTGDDAVLGSKAKWDAKKFKEFGDRLVKRLN